MKLYKIYAGALSVLAAATFVSCQQAPDYAKHDAVYPNIDTTVKPGDDFFKYANGAWLKKNPIPAAYSSWGIGNLVIDNVRERLKKINEDALNAKAENGTNTQKIGDFYYSGMDTVSIEKQGIASLKQELDRIDAIKDLKTLQSAFAHFSTMGVTTPIGDDVSQDEKNSDKVLLYLWQSGVGMPSRDYYFNNDKQSTAVRNDYQQKHLPVLFKLIGLDDAAAKTATERTYALEKLLADSSRKLEDIRDPHKNYNKMPLAGLSKLAPDIDWKTLLFEMKYGKADTVIVGQPEYYRAVNRALKTFSINDWKNYLRKNLVATFSNYLSKPFANESFRFYGTVMSGKKEQLPRWKRVLDTENNLMGEVLGQLFVKEYFPEKTKERYVKLVAAMRETFKERVDKLDWMTPATKQKTYDKLDKVTPKVGYPEKWKDYTDLKIVRGPYVANIISANIFRHKTAAAKLGKPVDRAEWGMTPQTYNAYYNPSNNEIVLPAAIFMIPGAVDENVDDAVVYGYAAASTIGHELTHGFDDMGRQFDAKGNLKAWWTAQDSAQFHQRTQKLVDQFNSFKVFDLHVNGKATLGENIADLGGIAIGLDAFKKTEQYKEGRAINGLTPLQRYFLGYALGWLGHQRDEALSDQVLTNEHSPGFLRVNGPFSDVPEFYEAFKIKKGDKMWLDPEKRAKIW